MESFRLLSVAMLLALLPFIEIGGSSSFKEEHAMQLISRSSNLNEMNHARDNNFISSRLSLAPIELR